MRCATARARAAVGALPFVLNLIARDQATTDRWAVAEATYQEAIGLARESGQQTELTFGLAGLAWLQARRGRESRSAGPAPPRRSTSASELGTRLFEIWATAALGELELGLGDAAACRRALRASAASCCPTLRSPTPISRPRPSSSMPTPGSAATTRRSGSPPSSQPRPSAKGQPWSLARALRCQGLLAADDPASPQHFERALGQHEQTPDAFEAARTRLAYGERLRRARNRVLAREQLRAAVDVFERLDARPWADRARAELAATGETRRRRDPGMIDELTPQELQIALAARQRERQRGKPRPRCF